MEMNSEVWKRRNGSMEMKKWKYGNEEIEVWKWAALLSHRRYQPRSYHISAYVVTDQRCSISEYLVVGHDGMDPIFGKLKLYVEMYQCFLFHFVKYCILRITIMLM